MSPMDGCAKGYSQQEKGRVWLIFYFDEEKVGGCYCSHMDGNAVQDMLVVSHSHTYQYKNIQKDYKINYIF